MEQLGENLRATLAGQAESREQSGQELAKLAQALQEGVAHAVEDSMAGMAVQLKDALARGDSADEESRSQAAAALVSARP